MSLLFIEYASEPNIIFTLCFFFDRNVLQVTSPHTCTISSVNSPKQKRSYSICLKLGCNGFLSSNANYFIIKITKLLTKPNNNKLEYTGGGEMLTRNRDKGVLVPAQPLIYYVTLPN